MTENISEQDYDSAHVRALKRFSISSKDVSELAEGDDPILPIVTDFRKFLALPERWKFLYEMWDIGPAVRKQFGLHTMRELSTYKRETMEYEYLKGKAPENIAEMLAYRIHLGGEQNEHVQQTYILFSSLCVAFAEELGIGSQVLQLVRREIAEQPVVGNSPT